MTFAMFSRHAHAAAYAYAAALRLLITGSGGDPAAVTVKTGEAAAEWEGSAHPPDAIVMCEDDAITALHPHAVQTNYGLVNLSYQGQSHVLVEPYEPLVLGFWADE